MRDGEPGGSLRAWLNALPAVQALLARHFGSAPSSKQNLCEWRAGGFAEWQVRQDTLAPARGLAAEATHLAAAVDGRLTDHLATVLAAHYAAALVGWNGEMTDPFARKLRTWRGLFQAIVALRRGDLTGARLNLDQERRARARAKTGEEMAAQFERRANDPGAGKDRFHSVPILALPMNRTPLTPSLSPSDGDHVSRSDFEAWGTHLVAGLGSHWVPEGRVRGGFGLSLTPESPVEAGLATDGSNLVKPGQTENKIVFFRSTPEPPEPAAPTVAAGIFACRGGRHPAARPRRPARPGRLIVRQPLPPGGKAANGTGAGCRCRAYCHEPVQVRTGSFLNAGRGGTPETRIFSQ